MASSATNSVLEACGVGKQFGGVSALKDVSLQVRRGEVLAVVGENGAGQKHSDEDSRRGDPAFRRIAPG